MRGDIISIVMEITNTEFKQALKIIHDILGLKFTISFKPLQKKYDPLDIFERAKSNTSYNKQELVFYGDDVLNAYNYIHLPHMLLVKEGIVPSVQHEFNVMYDTKSKRILFPHRYWSTGDIVGIFGRTVINEWQILNIPKYYGVLPYPKSLNLYGLYENYKAIQNYGYVVVVEGEKSVLKAKSLQHPNFVALGGHELSTEQIKILIGLDTEIVFALDNDVDKSISEHMCKEFRGIRNVSYIYDTDGLLGAKDAPIDKGRKKFEYLLQYCRQVI